jgi:type VI secretion system protein ImpL
VQGLARDHALRNILEPRMVALLEATMWRQIRDPDYLLGALKTYQMMTGLAPYDSAFVADWWTTALPVAAPIDPFPTEAAAEHQLAAIDRMAREEDRIPPDAALVNQALEVDLHDPARGPGLPRAPCHPEVTALPEWIPAEYAGPNGTRVFTRISERTLRVGLPGAFTFAGFHDIVLPLVPEDAAEAALDRTVFAGGCAESAEVSTDALETDILKLYYEDFVAQWDGLLRDLRLAPIEDLNTASANLRDLSSADSALARLLRAVVAETHLTRDPEANAAGDAAQAGVLKIAQQKLGKFGKLAGKAVAATGGGASGDPPGLPVAQHFAPIRGTVEEIDGIPPLLGDVQLALTALSNQVQTVLATPNPQQALLQQGGLPELTGAVANVAQVLPDPVDDWIAGIAGDTLGVTRDAVIAQLNARWRADVLPFCTSAVQGRYPFDGASAIDVNTLDFARLFGPGGLIDGFTNDHLLPYIDNATRPWRWRADFGLDDALLQPVRERAVDPRRAVPGRGGAGHGLHARTEGPVGQRLAGDAERRRPVAGLLQRRRAARSR